MKNKKILAILITLILILIVIVILIVKLQYEANNPKIDTEGDNPTLSIDTDVKRLIGQNMIFQIENIVKNDIQDINSFYIEDAYYTTSESDEETYAFIYGTMWYNDFSQSESDYMIINISGEKNLYSLDIKQRDITKQEYDEIIEKLKNGQIKIEDNVTYDNNNIFENKQVSEEDIIRRYMDYYTTLALYAPEKAYDLLENEYKEKRYGSLEEYLQYVEENRTNLEMLTLKKYSFKYDEEYTQYVAIDTRDNYYIIKANNLFDYELQLDNYTIEAEDYISKYNNLNEDEKAKVCVTKIIKMINTKDFDNLYNLIDEIYKANNFSSIDIFKSYLNEKYFEYNVLDETSITSNANSYICQLTIKDDDSLAAEEVTNQIVIKLGENTNFSVTFVK